MGDDSVDNDGNSPTSTGRGARTATLRMRLSLLVVATVMLGIGVGTALDYRRERHDQIVDLFDGLQDESTGLELALARIHDPLEFDDFVDQYCARMDEHVSPGHQILVFDSHGSILVNARHGSGPEVTRVLTSTDKPRSIFTVGDHHLAQIRSKTADGYTIVVAQYMDPVENELNGEVVSRMINVAVIGLVLMLLIFLLLNRMVLRPVTALAAAAKAWSARNFAARSKVTGSAELRALGAELNSMAVELEHVERTREAELVRARAIQASLLPRTIPAVPGLSIAALYRPAEFVAGDLYDVFVLPSGNTAILVLDVSGHGISAALLTGVVKMSIQHWLAETEDPAEGIRRVNRDLLMCTTQGQFVTMCVGIWNHTDRTWTYCAAGHDAGVLIADGRLTSLPGTGALLGVLEDFSWTSTTVKLSVGERAILFTDGVIEAGAPSQPLGSSGMAEVLQASMTASLRDMVSRLVDEANRRCEARACDDMTILGFEVLPGDDASQNYAI